MQTRSPANNTTDRLQLSASASQSVIGVPSVVAPSSKYKAHPSSSFDDDDDDDDQASTSLLGKAPMFHNPGSSVTLASAAKPTQLVKAIDGRVMSEEAALLVKKAHKAQKKRDERKNQAECGEEGIIQETEKDKI
jgi:hypothetical protein